MRRSADVLMSSGGGRLHFIEAAASLLATGVDLQLIVGMRPPPDWLCPIVNSLGTFFGKPDIVRRLRLRLAGVPSERLLDCAAAEAWIHVMYRLADFGVVDRSPTQANAWRAFGRASCRWIRPGGRVFHVRSGAGQGGAIRRAKGHGYRVVVDHSIAHPALINRLLSPVQAIYGREDFENFESEFWDVVLADCWEADVLLVNSDFVKQSFAQFGFPSDRIQVAYWGVRADFLGAKRVYRRNGKRLRILFTGAFTLRKGAHDVVAALAELDRRAVEYELVVAGGSHMGPSLVKRAGLRGSVRFLGHLPQEALRQLFVESDLYLFPSLAEGSARSAMEAMGAGMPIITTENTGLPNQHGVDSWVVQVGAPSEIADAICMLAGDESTRRRLGSMAAEKVATQYQWRNYAKKITEIYM
jgi:glycosyltransferase involved in cell wall biosynthesis